MEIFTTVCTDNKTNMQIILRECSYNMACCYLENKMRDSKFIGCKSINDDLISILYDSRSFIYDEDREMLLGA